MRADSKTDLTAVVLLAAKLGLILRLLFRLSAAAPDATEVLLLPKPLPLLCVLVIAALL